MDLKTSQPCPGRGQIKTIERGCIAGAVPGLRHSKWVVLWVHPEILTIGHRIICPGVNLTCHPRKQLSDMLGPTASR